MKRLEPILSEGEIKALLEGTRPEPGAGLRVSAESIDLLADDRYLRPIIPQLQTGYARVAEALRRVLTSVLRSKVEVHNETPEILSGRGLVSVAEHAACLIVLKMTPKDGEPTHGVLALDPTFTFSVIERLFGGGGGGEPADAPNNRCPTALERRMLLRALAPLFDVLNTNLEPAGFLRLEPFKVESRLDLVPGYTPDIAVLHVPFTMTIGDRLASLSLTTPAAAYDALRGRSARRLDAHSGQGVGRVLHDVGVKVSVELGMVEMTLRRILAMLPGEVITLDRNRSSELPVRIEGVTKFFGRPIEDDGAIAVEITTRVGATTQQG